MPFDITVLGHDTASPFHPMSDALYAAMQPRREFAGVERVKDEEETASHSNGITKHKIPSVPPIHHRNPNPAHINTTSPLGQRQGGYSQGVATGLFLRYFFEWLGERLHNEKSLINQNQEKRLVEPVAKKKAIEPILKFVNDNRDALQEVEDFIVKDVQESIWKKGSYITNRTKAEAIDAASKRVSEKLRTVLRAQPDLNEPIRHIFRSLGSEDAAERTRTILNDIYSRLYRDVAEDVIGLDPNSRGPAKGIEPPKITSEIVGKYKLGISGSRQFDIHDLTRSSVAKKLRSRFYDYGLGAYSLGLTGLYAGKVVTDMNRLFTESVAYELDKDPKDVTLVDIWKSDNGIIRETWNKWATRNSVRLATDALFFGRLFLPGEDYGKFGLFSKGLLVMHDLWFRRLTTFEKLSQFVEKVIKPEDGLGQPVTAEHLIDLFQAHAVHNRDSMAFQNVVGNNLGEEIRWGYAKQIFDRMAELMNNSYSYKHDIQIDEATMMPINNGKFTLPVFIFMLGHDMIDPNHPNYTRARIEIASEYGIRALKDVDKRFKQGTDVSDRQQRALFEQVLSEYPEVNVAWKNRIEEVGVKRITVPDVTVDTAQMDHAKLDPIAQAKSH